MPNLADFFNLAPVRRPAGELTEAYSWIDTFANSAGGVLGKHRLATDPRLAQQLWDRSAEVVQLG